MATMKKLMEGWRSYEKDVLNEKSYNPVGDMIKGRETRVPELPATTAARVAGAGLASAIERIPGNKLGMPTKEELDQLRTLSRKDLASAGLTLDDLDALENMEWTDLAIDFDDPVDVAIMGGGAVATASGVGAPAGVAAMGVKRAAKAAKMLSMASKMYDAKKNLGTANNWLTAGGAFAALNADDQSGSEIRRSIAGQLARGEKLDFTYDISPRDTSISAVDPLASAAADRTAMAQNRQGIYSDEAAASRLALLEPVSTYKVAPGDNMSRIAKNRGYSTEDMIAANPQIENPNEIEIDQEINLPTASTRV
jgi:hypothetical protein